jgi:hypothetical protein
MATWEAPISNSRTILFADAGAPHSVFGNRTAVGRRVHAWDEWFTIAGVARDSKYVSPNEAATKYLYAPYRQVFMS